MLDVRLFYRTPTSNPIICEVSLSGKYVAEIGADGWYPLSNYENGTWVRLVPERPIDAQAVTEAKAATE
jgi:hypothetical protein